MGGSLRREWNSSRPGNRHAEAGEHHKVGVKRDLLLGGLGETIGETRLVERETVK
jgi:hypothetical protein